MELKEAGNYLELSKIGRKDLFLMMKFWIYFRLTFLFPHSGFASEQAALRLSSFPHSFHSLFLMHFICWPPPSFHSKILAKKLIHLLFLVSVQEHFLIFLNLLILFCEFLTWSTAFKIEILKLCELCVMLHSKAIDIAPKYCNCKTYACAASKKCE